MGALLKARLDDKNSDDESQINTMTKSEFIIKLSEKNKILTENETETGVNLLLQTIMKALASNEELK